MPDLSRRRIASQLVPNLRVGLRICGQVLVWALILRIAWRSSTDLRLRAIIAFAVGAAVSGSATLLMDRYLPAGGKTRLVIGTLAAWILIGGWVAVSAWLGLGRWVEAPELGFSPASGIPLLSRPTTL